MSNSIKETYDEADLELLHKKAEDDPVIQDALDEDDLSKLIARAFSHAYDKTRDRISRLKAKRNPGTRFAVYRARYRLSQAEVRFAPFRMEETRRLAQDNMPPIPTVGYWERPHRAHWIGRTNWWAHLKPTPYGDHGRCHYPGYPRRPGELWRTIKSYRG